MPGVAGKEHSKEDIIELARTNGLLKGSVKCKELQYASGEAHTLVFKDHGGSTQTSLGSATVCTSQGNTVKLNGSPGKLERMLQLVKSWTMP